MVLKFDELTIEEEGRSNKSPLEIILRKGVEISSIASVVPYAAPTEEMKSHPGIRLVGYVFKKDQDCIWLSYDKLAIPGQHSRLGGITIHRDAIYMMEKLSS